MAETLSAGRELDALIAEKVIGEVEAHSPCGDGLTRSSVEIAPTLAECDRRIRESFKKHVADGMRLWPAQYCGPEYSTDIASAWLIVEKMRDHPDAMSRTLRMVVYPYNRTYATFDLRRDEDDWTEANGEHATPLAICLAALKAVESPNHPHALRNSGIKMEGATVAPAQPRSEGRE